MKTEDKTKTDCIFCKIIRGEIPSYTIYEDKDTKAFLDISQVSRGHTLVIPKKHYENIFETPKNVLKKVIEVSQKVSLLLKQTLGAEGINLVNSNNRAAQQDVFHYHMHVIPRYSGSNFKIEFKNPSGNKDFDKIKKEILIK